MSADVMPGSALINATISARRLSSAFFVFATFLLRCEFSPRVIPKLHQDIFLAS
jgi:hypothetical protein